MTFNSWAFFLFFVVVFTVSTALNRGPLRNWFLLLASLFFYASSTLWALPILLFSAVVDFWAGGRIHAAETDRRRKLLVAVSCTVNIGLLAFFKYADFFRRNFLAIVGADPSSIWSEHFDVIAPVGISFYTFQSLSYTVDVYRGLVKPAASFRDFLLYVAFFPQLVAGPIERARNLLPQISAPSPQTWARFHSGLRLVAIGLIKKTVIADNLGADVVDPLFDPASPTEGLLVWIALYAFAIQIYCDFSGYTDIAIGVARMMGYDFRPNFNFPYFAVDIRDFWRRWHISLSAWLRDYLYIPLGGSRKGHTYRNLMITMLLGGLWHGASWNFILWGAYHGALLSWARAAPIGLGSRLSAGTRRLLTFHLVCLGWLPFRSPSLEQTVQMGRSMVVDFGFLPDPDLAFTLRTLTLGAMFFVGHALAWKRQRDELSISWSPLRTGLVYVSALLAIIIGGEHGSDAFIYFQF